MIQLKDNSMFVCFAPREDPKICVAVVVQNAGYGSTWAAPIASLIVEKYLTDSIRTERLPEIKRISEANIVPDYFERLQYKTDSIRARKWFDLTKDSNYIRKYLPRQRITNSAKKQRNCLRRQWLWSRQRMWWSMRIYMQNDQRPIKEIHEQPA